MLYLKKINLEDADKEYEAIKKIPYEENGYINKYHDVTKEEFINKVIPERINRSLGINIPEGKVPETYYFLWNDDEIVGLFKIRHCLNESLRNGSGHIGYGILPDHRGKGYAKEGLKLAIEECKRIIKEDEIYLAVYKNNPASIKVQQANGAYIVSENEEEYFTRIKIR